MATSDQEYLADAPVWRSLVHLCLPMMAALSVGVVYNLINAWFVGRLNSTLLLSALTFGLPVLLLTMAVAGVFGVGGGSLASRLMGAGDEAPGPAEADAVRRVGGFVLWGSLLAGAAIGLLCLLGLDPLVRLLGTDPAAFGPTRDYVRVLFWCLPVLVAAFAMEQLVRSEGAARVSMTGIILSTVANFGFDLLFIALLGWGVAGAALAIGLANAVALGWFAWWLARRSTRFALSPRWFRPDLGTARQVFGVGVSEFLLSSFMILSTLVFNHVAAPYGDQLMAALGLSLRIAQVPQMLSMGITIGVLPLLAYATGAGNGARVAEAMRKSALAIGGLLAAFTLPILVLRDGVFQWFTTDPGVAGLGVRILVAMLLGSLFSGFTALVVTYFQATDRARPAAVMATAQGVVFVPVILVAQRLWGEAGVIWAITVSDLATFLIAAALLLATRQPAAPATTGAADALEAAVPAA